MDYEVNTTTMEDAPPSLLSLCLRAIRASIRQGYFGLEEILELPSHLEGTLIGTLDPLELESLQPGFEASNEVLAMNHVSRSAIGAKRGRSADFNGYWKAFFMSRWPTSLDEKNGQVCFVDWQQLYWEMHLQSCLDEASEKASLPGFNGLLGDLTVSDCIVSSICNTKDKGFGGDDYTKLAYHCKKFGHYARHLRLRSVLCVDAMLDQLDFSNLQHVVICNVKLGIHVDGTCNLLARNKNSLLSVEFLRCTLPPTAMGKICQSLGRSLLSLKFCETQLGSAHAKSIFNTLLQLPSSLSIFEISDSDVKSWKCNADFSHRSTLALCPGPATSLGSLDSICMLNLRGNELDKSDARDLRYSLANLQNLSCLDLGDNPLTDDGVRFLSPYFVDAMEKDPPLAELKLDNCHLSSVGVNELLKNISKSKRALTSLSIACNELGRLAAAELARFLRCSDIKTLDIEDIGLGPLGFQDFELELPKDLQLVELNISKNRGGIEAARCISKVIFHSPKIAAISASHNLMPPQSIEIVCHALEQSKGKLRKLDLTGNSLLHQAAQASKLPEFLCQGKPIVILPHVHSHVIPYDDDP